MKLAAVLVALAIVVIVWRSQHGVEIWHAAADHPPA
jgi:hypothetical protein